MLSSCLLVSVLALAGSTLADLTIVHPSSESWLVENADNTIQWSGTYPSTFATRVYNTNTSLLPADGTLIVSTAIGAPDPGPSTSVSNTVYVPIFLTPGVNYIMTFSDVEDATKIFATSQPFEVKPQGSVYSSFNLTVPARNITNPPTNPDGSSAVGGSGGADTGAGERVAGLRDSTATLGFVAGLVGLLTFM
ncbi:hypothetical protein BDY24DRAFT_383354 [Mrakia frigida]|uniref:uncharacterized protein n=1 Tax=Mrakia frigida TaxID=29902 RepID=UPI003FCBFCBC